MPTYETDEREVKNSARTVFLLFVSLFLVALLCAMFSAVSWEAGINHGRCEGYGLAQDPSVSCERIAGECLCGVVAHEVP